MDRKKKVNHKMTRVFHTGATRNLDTHKLDYDGFLAYPVLHAYAKYMHKHRRQKDGTWRESDNWQKGIPREVYRKSAFRHFLDWWNKHRQGKNITTAACAVIFNLMGDMFEYLKEKKKGANK